MRDMSTPWNIFKCKSDFWHDKWNRIVKPAQLHDNQPNLGKHCLSVNWDQMNANCDKTFAQ